MRHSISRACRAVVGVAACAAALGLLPATAWAGYVNYPDFSRTDGLRLNGSASAVDDMLRLTYDLGQAGSAFTKPAVIDPTQPIRASFEFHLHYGAADGMTFAIQRDPRGASALGGAGAAHGYGDGSPDGIRRSVAVEFDLWPDTSIFEDHVAILTDGVTQNDFGDPVQLAPVAADIHGGTRFAWVEYKPKTKNLSVFLSSSTTQPKTPITSATVNLRKKLGGSGRAGFTAGTGGEFAIQDIKSWKVEN
jgi:hypothetical protein